jgi:hypothetical protein
VKSLPGVIAHAQISERQGRHCGNGEGLDTIGGQPSVSHRGRHDSWAASFRAERGNQDSAHERRDIPLGSK